MAPVMRPDHPEEENLLMDQLALHVLQGQGVLDPSPDWHGSTMIPAWQRDGARDSAYSIASCFRQSATSRSPAEVQAHTSNATPYFGSPAFTWSGAGTPGSEPDLRRCSAVRFSAFHSDADDCSILQEFFGGLQYPDSGFDEQPDFEAFARHSKGAPSAGHSLVQGDGTRRPTRVTRTRKEHAELVAAISRERVLELLHIPQKEAAGQLRICLSTFKKICRGYV